MQPYYSTALGMAQNAAQPITAAQIAQYQNPYTQGVVNTTQAQFNNQNAQQLEDLRGRSISQGAMGGNRQGVAEAELANQQKLAQSPVIANLMSQGYTTGLNTALTQQQTQAQGAYGVANLANAGLTGANAQVGAGGLLQGTQQQQDVANYQQFLNQLGYPFQTTQWLAGLGTGVGSQMGGTNYGTGSTTGPAPSMLGQLMGGASSGVGLLGASGAFGSAGWMMPALAALKHGGRVHGYADGGVANLNPVGDTGQDGPVPESDASLAAQQRQLLSGNRRAQMFPNGTPELPLPQGMARTQTPNGTFHYNPNALSEDAIHGLSAQDRENELLDLGPVSKREVMARVARGENPLAVVERDPDGNEVRAAAGTDVTAPAQLAAMHKTKSPGHSVGVEHLHNVIAHRLHGRGHGVAHRDMGGMVMPYSGGKSWIPNSAITPGHGAPGGMNAPGQPQDQGGFDLNKQAKNIGYLADALKGNRGLGDDGLGSTNDPNWTGGTPLDESAPIGGPGGGIGSARRGGAIVGIANGHHVRGYAGGGAPDNAMVFDPNFAGAPADQFMPVGVAPSMYDEAGFATPFPSRSDLAAASPSNDYDRFDTVPVRATEAAMPTFSERPSSSYDEAGFDGGLAPPPVRRVNAYTDTVQPPANYKSAFERFREANPATAADVPRPTIAGSRGSNADLAPQDSSTTDWGWGSSDPYASPKVAPSGVAPLQADNRPIDVSGTAFPADDTFSTPQVANAGVAPIDTSGTVFPPDAALNLDSSGEAGDVPLPQSRPDVPGRPSQGVAPPKVGAASIPRSAYTQEVLFAANKYGIPPNVALRLVNQESGFKQIDPRTGNALTSHAGAIGITQLMPGTARDLGVDPYNAYQNIHGGMRYLSQMYAKYGDWPTALAAYNAGPKRVDAVLAGKSSMPAETRDYVASIMGGGKIAPSSSDGSPGERALAFNGEASPGALPNRAYPVQYTPPGIANASPGVDLGADSKLWPTLISAGFGMMASRSPFPGVAVGEGGLTGLQTYSGMKQQEQTRALSQQKLDLEARKLSTEADRWERDYKVKQQQANTNEAYRSSLADRGKYTWQPGPGPAKDADGNPVMGPDGKPAQTMGFWKLPTQTNDPDMKPEFHQEGSLTGKQTRHMTAMDADKEARLYAGNFAGRAPDNFASEKEKQAYQQRFTQAYEQKREELRRRWGITEGQPSTGAPPATAPVNPAAPSASAAPPAANAPPPRPASVPPTAKAYSNGRETRWATPEGLFFNDKGQRINAQGQVI